MSLLPARMRKIQSNMKALVCSKHVSNYKYMGFFSRRSRAADSAVGGLIWPNFELIRDFMVVNVTCKNEEDPFKNDDALKVFKTFSPF